MKVKIEQDPGKYYLIRNNKITLWIRTYLEGQSENNYT